MAGLPPNPIREKRDLLQILGLSNPATLIVRNGISGEVSVRSFDPLGVLPEVVVPLQPSPGPGERQYDLLEFAPIACWRESASLLTAVESGLLFVDLSATPVSAQPAQVALVLPPIAGTSTMATNEPTDSLTFVVIGGISFAPEPFVDIRFTALASVNDASLTGEVQLFNLTDSVLLVTHTYAGILTPTKTVSSPLILPAGQKVYEVRARVTGGSPTADQVLVTWAGFETLITEK